MRTWLGGQEGVLATHGPRGNQAAGLGLAGEHVEAGEAWMEDMGIMSGCNVDLMQELR